MELVADVNRKPVSFIFKCEVLQIIMEVLITISLSPQMEAVLDRHTPGDDLEGVLLTQHVEHHPWVLLTLEHPDKSHIQQLCKSLKLYQTELLVLMRTPEEEQHDGADGADDELDLPGIYQDQEQGNSRNDLNMLKQTIKTLINNSGFFNHSFPHVERFGLLFIFQFMTWFGLDQNRVGARLTGLQTKHIEI